MMEIKLEDKTYNAKHIFEDLTIKELENVLNIQNDDIDLDEKCIDVLELITDMTREELELGDIDSLNNLLKELMELNIDVKNEIEIDNIKYKTFMNFTKQEDIKLNRIQFKNIKDKIIDTGEGKINYLGAIAATFFMEKEDFLLKDIDSYNKRKEIFEEKMLSKYIIPYMFKFINSMTLHVNISPVAGYKNEETNA